MLRLSSLLLSCEFGYADIVLHKEIGAFEHVLVDPLSNVLYAAIHSYKSCVIDMTVTEWDTVNHLAFNLKGRNNVLNSYHKN